MIPPQRILLSGGGMKGIALIGALRVLEQAAALRKVKEYCGVSVGAWIAFMLACKTSLPIIKRLVLELNFGGIRNINPEAIIYFPETFGLDDGSKFVAFLESLFRLVLKIEPTITFRGLSQISEIAFRCWATDLTDRCVREFSLKATPDVKIIDALRATTAIPFYFTPVSDPLTGHMLSDGGIQGNLPLHYLDDDEREETLALGFSGDLDSKITPETLMDFTNAVFSCLIHSRHEEILEQCKHRILRIPLKYPSWNFEASREDRTMLLNKGRTSAIVWIASGSMWSRPI